MNCQCGQPAPNAYLCRDCQHELEQLLAELPALTGYLNDAIVGQVRFGAGRVGGRSAEPPMVVNFKASELAGVLRNLLVGVIRHLVESRGVNMTRLPDDDLGRMATWVAVHVDSLLLDETAGETLRDLRGVTKRIVHIIDRPPDKEYAGICSIERNGQECPQELYAERGAAFIRCRGCGYNHEVEARRDVLKAAARDTLLTIVEMKTALPVVLGVEVNERTLRTWRHRKRIAPHGVTYDGRELFRCGDIIDLVANMEGRAS